MPLASSGGNLVTSSSIVDGSIVNDDINAAAAIAISKLTGVAAKGANSDITSLSGLTTPLSQAQGGTGSNLGVSNIVGALGNSFVKTFFNIKLAFLLWTGSANGALTTDFTNWIRSSGEITMPPLGMQAVFGGTGNESIYCTTPLYSNATTTLKFNGSGKIILDWWGIFPATGTGDAFMGFCKHITAWDSLYNDNINGNYNRIGFGYDGTDGKIYATSSVNGAGITTTECTGITNTLWNNFRIELDLGVDVKFYINGVLKATISGANLQTGADVILMGFSRSDTLPFAVTAPDFAMEINP
jgi:hypothetical protein